jgi:catechol 2,3-dioxygenase-like lactoylglutathione lyase family enzyme
MTQITGFIPPSRRPGVLGVHSMDHFTLQVPDLEEARRFYQVFGLDVREEGNGLALYTHGHPHCWGRLLEGPRKKLAYVSFGAFADDMPRFATRLQELGITRTDPPPGQESNGIWFRDPWGTLLEIKVAEKSSPSAKAVVDNSSAGPGVHAMPLRKLAPEVKPRRLSHILLFTPDVPAAIDFYSRTVGVRLSDEAGGVVAFLHGVHGSDHHMVAFAKSDGPGFHHCSWDVESTHAVGLGAMRMAEKGHARGWGVGRHVLGSNFFHYVRDPWGSYSEYSSDIDYVPVDMEWQEIHCDAEDGFYLWGPTPPADFVTNFETA